MTNQLPASRPCQAENKMECRFHAAGYITAEIFPPIYERGFRISQEEVEIFTEDIIKLINTAGKNDSDIEHGRDEKNIYEQWQMDHPHDSYGMDAPVESLIHEIVFRYDSNKTKLPENNVLDPNKRLTYGAFTVALGTLIAKEGCPVKPNDGYYGWKDYDMDSHIKSCEIVSISNPKEKTWGAFNGTFNDEDDSVHGAEAEAQCKCGNFKGRMRIEGSLTNLTRKLFDY
jgi:hypothetical protein